MRDGTTRCAQLLRAFDSDPTEGEQAILEIDLVNAFNSASRQAAFVARLGTTRAKSSAVTLFCHSRAFGTSLAIHDWRAMHGTAATLRPVGADGQVHRIRGTTGGRTAG